MHGQSSDREHAFTGAHDRTDFGVSCFRGFPNEGFSQHPQSG
jgi:hypothetical protein